MTLCSVVQPYVVPKSLSFSIFPYILLLNGNVIVCVANIYTLDSASDMPMLLYRIRNIFLVYFKAHIYIGIEGARIFLCCSVSYVKFIHLI